MTTLLLGMPYLFGGMTLVAIAVFGAIAVSHKEKRVKAEAEVARLKAQLSDLTQEIGRFRSAGAELAQRVGWWRQKLMNREEYRVYRDLERIVAQANGGHLLFVQVSYGAFLDPKARPDQTEIRDAAYHALARKRADFLIIDRCGWPVAVIEYQGAGHYQGNAHDRDHAKRVACQRANLRLIEVPAAGLTEGQRIDLCAILGGPRALAAE